MTETVSAKTTRFFIFYIPPIEGASVAPLSCTPDGVSHSNIQSEVSATFDLGATVYRTGLLPNSVCSKSLFYNNMLSNNVVKRRRILRLQSNFGKAPSRTA